MAPDTTPVLLADAARHVRTLGPAWADLHHDVRAEVRRHDRDGCPDTPRTCACTVQPAAGDGYALTAIAAATDRAAGAAGAGQIAAALRVAGLAFAEISVAQAAALATALAATLDADAAPAVLRATLDAVRHDRGYGKLSERIARTVTGSRDPVGRTRADARRRLPAEVARAVAGPEGRLLADTRALYYAEAELVLALALTGTCRAVENPSGGVLSIAVPAAVVVELAPLLDSTRTVWLASGWGLTAETEIGEVLAVAETLIGDGRPPADAVTDALRLTRPAPVPAAAL